MNLPKLRPEFHSVEDMRADYNRTGPLSSTNSSLLFKLTWPTNLMKAALLCVLQLLGGACL